MRSNKRLAFTLIELIVVIAIISILAIAAIVIVNKWISKSRNSVRLTDLNQIAKSLDMSYVKYSEYPKPTNGVPIDTSSGNKIGYQWVFWEDMLDKWVDITKIPLDPLDKDYYLYTEIVYPKLWYEIWAYMEADEESLSFRFQNNVYADGLSRVLYLLIKYQWRYFDTNNKPVFPKPLSFMKTGSIENITTETLWDSATIIVNFATLTEQNIEKKSIWWADVWWDYIVATGVVLSGADGWMSSGDIAPGLPVVAGGWGTDGPSWPVLVEQFTFSKVNNFWWIWVDIFTTIIKDWSDYLTVGFSKSDLSSYNWWSNNTGVLKTVIARFDNNLDLIKIANQTWWELNSVIQNGADYISVWIWINDNFMIIKFDSNLDISINNQFWWTWFDVFNDVLFDGTDYIAVWSSDSDLSNYTSWSVSIDNTAVIAKFDTSLNLTKIVNFTGWDFSSVIQDGTNYIAAWIWSNDNFIVAKFDSNLDLVDIFIWEWIYDEFTNIILDGTNYIVVWYSSSDLSNYTWWSTNPDEKERYVIAKFDQNLNLLSINNELDWLENTSVVKSWTNYIAVWIGLWAGSTDFYVTEYNNNLNLLRSNNIVWDWFDIMLSNIKDWDDMIAIWFSNSDLSNYTWWTISNWNPYFVIWKINTILAEESEWWDTTPPMINYNSLIINSDVTIDVFTNEVAMRKWDTTDDTFDNLSFFFWAPWTNHNMVYETPVNWTNNLYVRCSDTIGNANITSTVISFTYNGGGWDTTPPVITNPLPTWNISTSPVTLQVITDEIADCAYDTIDTDFEDMEYRLWTTDNLLHSKSYSATPWVNTLYVRCEDYSNDGYNSNTTSTIISFTYDEIDTTPPVLSNLLPSGTISNSSTTLDITTDEITTCKYDITDVVYDIMSNTFTNTIDTSHNTSFTASNWTNTIYVWCIDSSDNIGTWTISFTLDITPPVISVPLPSWSVYNENISLGVTTDESATCKYDTTDIIYDSMSNTFSTTNSTSHSTNYNTSMSWLNTIYVRCADSESPPNKNTTSITISFTLKIPIMVKDIYPGSGNSNPWSLENLSWTLFFRANEWINWNALWKSDGTSWWTVLVKDIYPDGNNNLLWNLTNINWTLFFGTYNWSSYFMELWKSDGTSWWTVIVKDFYPDGNNTNFTNINWTLFFTANDWISWNELWKSDGTSSWTVLVKDISPYGNSYPDYLTNVNWTLFFQANQYELWKSDGTSWWTVLVKNFVEGGNPIPTYLTNLNWTLFFTADDWDNWPELWKSDGTSWWTVMVKDIGPDGDGISPSYITNINWTLFFRVNGSELWKSDGTSWWTILVKDIEPDGYLIDVNWTAFFIADDWINWNALWKSDGTSWWTTMVKDFNSNPYWFTNINWILFFRAYNLFSWRELWKSDGTSWWTVIVKDINPSGNSSPYWLTNINWTLFFSTND